MSKSRFIGAFDLLQHSARIMRDNVFPYAVVFVAPTVLTSLSDEKNGAIFALIGVLFTVAFYPAVIKLYLITAKGNEAEISELFENSYRYFWRLIGLSLLVGISIVIGFLLFIIPGLIMLRRYIIAPMLLMDKDMAITEAMKESARLTKPYSWKIYPVLGVAFLFGVIAAIGPVGYIAGTILAILYAVAIPIRYYELLKANKLKPGGKY